MNDTLVVYKLLRRHLSEMICLIAVVLSVISVRGENLLREINENFEKYCKLCNSKGIYNEMYWVKIQKRVN